MAHALALDGHDLALKLHLLMGELDPVRLREDVTRGLQERFRELERQLADLEARVVAACASGAADEAMARFRESTRTLLEALQEHLPGDGGSTAEMRRQWAEFRARLQPAYDDLTLALRQWRLRAPSFRPTNVSRSVFHFGAALASVLVVEALPGPNSMRIIAATIAVLAWTLEISRRFSVRSDRFSWWLFGRMAHPHERKRINSATWYSTALLALALPGSAVAAAVGLAVLGVADPVAGFVGRRWGRHRLVQSRTLEGSLGFVAAGLLAAVVVLVVWHWELGPGVIALLAVASVLPAAVAELVVRRVDDNLAIPVVAAAGVLVTGALLGGVL